jgi:hypothetical protein
MAILFKSRKKARRGHDPFQNVQKYGSLRGIFTPSGAIVTV